MNKKKKKENQTNKRKRNIFKKIYIYSSSLSVIPSQAHAYIHREYTEGRKEHEKKS